MFKFQMSCLASVMLFVLLPAGNGYSENVHDDPLVRMPGSQPGDGITLEAPGRCLNCHAGYNTATEPGFNWMGSMMAQAQRDPIFWACLTVAAQDAQWAVGSTNATDLCLRCHTPAGWLAGRSDPTNGSALVGSDFDGLHCDTCHRMMDPFFENTYRGLGESSDWINYWDEANNIAGVGGNTLSQTLADQTYAVDVTDAQTIKLFSGGDFFANNRPRYIDYTENGGGQYFMSHDGGKRSSFADAEARHQILYTRYHKSRDFCGTCHDVSNPVLANAAASIGLPLELTDQTGGEALISEQYSAAQYFHVERTFSEFMLSAYGRGGAATNPEFQSQGAPDVVTANKCQDCHMRDVVGVGCDKNGVPLRPDESTEHPNSGLPLHDLTGGNAWMSHILASLDPNGPVYDPVNEQLLSQGPAVLTLDLSAGESPVNNGAALKAGSDRALQQLRLAATIKHLQYNPDSGVISFQVLNNTGHKLISGFPEGRRMWVNIKLYQGETLIQEINPYDMNVGTLKGLGNSSVSPLPADDEMYIDELVYEVHPSSDITQEEQTFHFVLATGRSKDNRIPPKGFDITGADDRLIVPVWHGEETDDYFTAEEYAGGYDQVYLALNQNADRVEVKLYYQGTSREYVEFLKHEINGTAQYMTLPESAYIAQSDPFFAQLKAWGDTIWGLWEHNHGLDGQGALVAGIVPFEMAGAAIGEVVVCDAPQPQLLSLDIDANDITLTWSDEHTTNQDIIGYAIYHDQQGKSQFITQVGLTTSYVDEDVSMGQEYSYKVAAITSSCSSGFSNVMSVYTGSGDSPVVSRYVFYNNSAWDGYSTGATTLDSQAIAVDKQAAYPGQQVDFSHYTSYSKGINGIIIDIDELPAASLSADDFSFLTGNSSDLSQWTIAPQPIEITVLNNNGIDGSDRVVLIWSDNAIQKQWLRVVIKANINTGLDGDDVFYFGNAIGECGDQSENAVVDATDEISTRNSPRSFMNPATIDYPFDFNRDRKVDATDQVIARNHHTDFTNALNLIILP